MQQNEFFIVNNNLSDVHLKKKHCLLFNEVQVLEYFNKNIKMLIVESN